MTNAITRCRTYVVGLAIGSAIVAGCGKTEEDKKPVTQVAARVNSTEITVSQINAVLARTPNVTPETSDRVKREILEKLVDQELAKQQAIEKKLDQLPEVLRKLENAKSDVLVGAYFEQIAAKQPRPTPQEAKEYFAQHPELFSSRRIFDVEEIVVEPKPDLAAALKEQVTKARSMEEIAKWLQSRDVRFYANKGIRPAEQIPLEFLRTLQGMKDGEIQVFDSVSGTQQIVHLVGSKAQPVSEAAALPRIQQFLYSRNSREAVAKEFKALKESAKIEYVGEFAVSAAEAGAKAKANAEAKAKQMAEEKSKAEAAAKARAAAAQSQADADAKERAERLAKARAEAEKDRLEAEAKAKAKAKAEAKDAPAAETLDKGARGLK